MDRRKRILVGVTFELGLGLVALLVGPLLGIRPWEGVQPQRFAADLGLGLLATLPVWLAYLWARRTSWAPIARLQRQVRTLVHEWLAPAAPLELVVLALAAGVGEELSFRGLLQAWLQNVTHWTTAWLLASLIFGAVHAVSTSYFLVASLMGGYLGGLWLQTGSVVVPIVVHALYDWLVLRDVLARGGMGNRESGNSLAE